MLLDAKHVAVGVDGSPTGVIAVRSAAQLAQQIGARLSLVTVVNIPTSALELVGAGREMIDTLVADLSKTDQADAEAACQEAGVPFSSFGIHQHRGTPGRSMAQFARENDVDLLFVGAHGRGLPVGLYLGSVARWVAEHAPCSVVVIRAPEDSELARRDRKER